MGIFLNPGSEAFREAIESEIYVDKTNLIRYLNRVLRTQQKYVCVSRPRRFGKSTAVNMISAYYDKTVNGDIFKKFHIFDEDGMKQQGRYDVIRINMQEFLSNSSDVNSMVALLSKVVLRELQREYPDVDYLLPDKLTFSMQDIFSQKGNQFVILIDEWDCIFREYPHDIEEQKKYLDFLRDWLKDKTYVALAYMTGILPIKKYGTHSALNMFNEFSMENPGELAQYVGFTETEVHALCESYHIDAEECSYWYNGYYFPQCGHIYNPTSIVSVMLTGIFDDYWNKTETYNALKIYIDLNYKGLKTKLTALMAGDRIQIDSGHFKNDMTSFSSADDVLTLLIHLGYLGYDFENKQVFIPNHEIQMEFVRAMDDESWDSLQAAIHDSTKLLQSTWDKNEEAVAEGVEKVHDETSHLQYNDENALSYTVSLAYYAARQYYTIVRELPSGKGFADLTFIPRKKYAYKPAMIIELKWNKDADGAISQIKRKQYTKTLAEYAGNILLVGINYDRTSKKHQCRIENG